MTKVTITRHYSGFNNVADKFSLGNHEHDGAASVSDYVLPEGYAVDGEKIFDPANCECEIVPHDSGRPQLVSLVGRITASPVLIEDRP